MLTFRKVVFIPFIIISINNKDFDEIFCLFSISVSETMKSHCYESELSPKATFASFDCVNAVGAVQLFTPEITGQAKIYEVESFCTNKPLQTFPAACESLN